MQRMVRIGIVGAVTTVGMAWAGPASAGDATNIEFGDNFFDPRIAGPAVVNATSTEATWSRAIGAVDDHNISSNNRLFKSGPPNQVVQFSIEASAGTFRYVCDNHASEMKGTLKVVPGIVEQSATKAKITWANADSDTGDRYDVQFRQKGKPKWVDWFENTRRRSAVFGKNNKPIKVRPNKTYQVRARSSKGTSKIRQSGFSPPVEYDAGID